MGPLGLAKLTLVVEDFDTVALLTAGKTPRRRVKLGEGARPVTPDLRDPSAPVRPELVVGLKANGCIISKH